MNARTEVTDEHLQRAYAQMRKHDTPPLAVLRDHWVLFSCLRNRALGIANGQPLPPEPVATAPPAPTPKPTSPQRRRDDYSPRPPQFSTRAAQAGEYAHKDDNE